MMRSRENQDGDYKPPNEAAGYRGLILEHNRVSLTGRLQPPAPPSLVRLQVDKSRCQRRLLTCLLFLFYSGLVLLILHRIKYKVPLTLHWMGNLGDFKR